MKKVSILLVGLIILATLLAGCGSKIDKASNNEKGTPSEETPQVSEEENKKANDAEEIAKEYISNVETKYVVVDPQKEIADDDQEWEVIDNVALEKVEDSYKIKYLKENYPEIQKVKNVATEFLKAILNVNYKSFTGREIAPYLTQKSVEIFTDDGFFDAVKEDAVSNELVMQFVNVEKFNLTFNKDLTKCRVDVYPIVKVLSSKGLGEGLELNKEYWYFTVLWAKKENDIWKIEDFKFEGFKDIE